MTRRATLGRPSSEHAANARAALAESKRWLAIAETQLDRSELSAKNCENALGAAQHARSYADMAALEAGHARSRKGVTALQTATSHHADATIHVWDRALYRCTIGGGKK
jgi:hypothetical protein